MNRVDTALALDPLSVGVNDEIGGLFVLMRHYDEAILHLRQFIATGGDIARTHLQLAEALALKGDYDAALAELGKTSASGGEQTQWLAETGYAYGAAGRQREARAILDQLLALQRQHADGSEGAIATVYAALGDRDRAIAWLDQARLLFDPVITRLKVDPRFDKLRGDARFAKLLATVGLAQ